MRWKWWKSNLANSKVKLLTTSKKFSVKLRLYQILITPMLSSIMDAGLMQILKLLRTSKKKTNKKNNKNKNNSNLWCKSTNKIPVG